jgi:hypothetical protein
VRFTFLGTLVYYLTEVRQLWTRVSYEEYRRRFRGTFLASGWTQVIRWIHYLSLPAFLGMVAIGMLSGAWLRSGRLLYVTLVAAMSVGLMGAVVAGYFVYVLLRDAAIRWNKSVQDRALAQVINSSFFREWAAEAYFKAVGEREYGRGNAALR